MDDPMETPPRPAPYFLPPGIDFEALPEPVKLAFEAIVEPAYSELVLGAKSSLERSAGVTVVFLLSLEVIDQFELGHGLNMSGMPNGESSAERESSIAAHFRLLGAKQAAANFLIRLRALRAKYDDGDRFRKPVV